ncbi:hypothetical protein Xcel_1461 [Xylanimonas cellulosilytica DSM 15894]|uniref:Signal transduction histidine kinase subgroup 3 dimerisation and phosphoacceptor domain-containing protein n=1 Tax=Xylanimonas cellulosilytica (strain DSM 15894 / JCM 12276 / CECT 5975 / KCTC 9989 / LMG 20990 / NBRC 107835 / XIL07) TaxID=446471 RepID=D1BS00_XYLCX|nr:histidine kinase [Xylanimonas cellulosilytica]ACZ30492.1 hypothetical protein Xcel_1461 [Xylanimonas cellulosilytica DSM 15894]
MAGDDVRPAPPRPVYPVAVGAVGLALTAWALSGGTVAAHATVTPAALGATAAAALLVVGAGTLAALSPRHAWPGRTTLLAGLAWLAPVLVGWIGAPSSLRAAAMVVAPFAVVLLAHLVLAGPDGIAPWRGAARLVVVGYAATALLTTVLAVTRDPLLELHCWRDCAVRVLAVAPQADVARAASTAWSVALVVVGVGATGVAVVRTVRARPGARLQTAVVVVPAALALAGYATWGAAVLADPPERPDALSFQAAYLVQALGMALLGAGVAWPLLREHRRRTALRRLAARLGAVPAVGSLQAHLADALDDPSLEVAYWLPESRRFVDAAGRNVNPDRSSARSGARAGAELRRGDDLLAVVTLGRAGAGDAPLTEQIGEQIGAAARLAIDNERLQAEIRAQLTELRSSRRRIVAAADESRRRLERDLHDGVQADLVALLLDAGRRHAAAVRAGDEPTARALTDVVAQVSAAAARLRELSHGIFPAELAEAGLEPALWTLTDDADVAVRLAVDLDVRPPAEVERVGYLVAVEALACAQPGAVLEVAVSRTDSVVTVRAMPLQEPVPVDLDDRVGALGGTARRTDAGWEVDLPCALS